MMEGIREAVREWFADRSRAWLYGENTGDAENSLHPAGALDISRRSAMQKRRGAVDRKVISDISVRLMKGETRQDDVTVEITEMVRYLYELAGCLEHEQRVYRHRQVWRTHQGRVSDLVARSQEGEEATADAKQDSFERTAERASAAAWGDRAVDARRYVRARAVRYAELWWDRHNPEYSRFDQDCTNFVSQALYAGGVPMIETGRRETGWWYRRGDHLDHSYSWAVANALAVMLQSGGAGIPVEVVASPAHLQVGDIIQYDWKGAGRYGHTTIVTGHDQKGDPLVNAHTQNSRRRHYSYEDSAAWTPGTRYLLCHLLD
ncbi:MAG: amidase domain-containing protein [Bacilli bacterium]